MGTCSADLVMLQDAVVQVLEDPRFYPHHPETVEHVQTHISHVFLAGPYVYKLKKAVRFPFLDFGTAELRRHFCAEEVRLNRRLAPGVYLDVVPITRGADGELRLGGGGHAVEHLVWMRRLPADRMLASLLAASGVRGEMIDTLARTIAAFHIGAPTGPDIAAHAHPESLRARWADETRGTTSFAGDLLPEEDHEVLADFGPSFIRAHETLLRARQHGGQIREGHGDLHAEHVCFVEAPLPGGPDVPSLPAGIYVFDCIEFSRAFRCNDVASEVAFLAMDLDSLGEPEMARRFVAAYAEAARDPLVPVLLPFYACYRAVVRGKVEGLKSREPEVGAGDREAAARRARRHFTLAVGYAWRAGGPAVIACSGLAGAGKTTLARELAATTGFVLLGTDAIRKRGEEHPAGAPYAAGRYGAAAREAVYETLSAEADAALAAGHGVVADATFLRAADRRRLAAVAEARRAPLVFVECLADEAIVRTRLEARVSAPSLSDARWDTCLAHRKSTCERGRMTHSRCLCGAVSWDADGPFQMMSHCHCSRCRKAHGTPFATYAAAPADSFRLSGREHIGRWESSPGFFRCFCTGCGSVVPGDPWEDLVFLPAGCMESDPGVRPAAHIFVASRAPWFDIRDDLPRFDAYPPGVNVPAQPDLPLPDPPGRAPRGSCLCGAVAYLVEGPPLRARNCHCSRCRKGRGAAYASNLITAADGLRWTRGADLSASYKVPEARFFTQSFCRRCGSPVPRIDRERNFAVVPMGALDDDPGMRPEAHIFVGSKAPWYDIPDALPRYEEYPPAA